MQFANAVRTLTLCSALALLGSCGGGGNDFPETPSQPNANTNPNTGTTTTPQTTPVPTPTNTGDTQAPRASMILPADNATVTGNIQLLADASDNVAVAGVQFRVGDILLGDGLIPQPPYTTDFDTTYLPDGTHAFSARAYDTSGNVGNAPARSARVRNTCKTASPRVTQWQNTSFEEQSGTFNAEWQVTPVTAGADAIIGLARGAQDDWSGLSTAVRFNTNNTIDAMNGGTYGAAAAISYSPQVTYRIRMRVDVAARRYSAYVAPPGGAEQTIAENYAFRRSANRLDYWVVEAEQGALRGCRFSVSPVETPPPPPPANTEPRAAMTAMPTSGTAPLDVSFDASQSSDAEGPITYAWSFGDGASTTGVAVRHTYNTAGTYVATLTVTDSAGASSSATETISVDPTTTADAPPTAHMVASPTDGAPPLTVNFDGSLSSDDQGISLYTWDFGDGTPPLDESDPIVTHTYTSAGEYTATLTVRDTANQSDSSEPTPITVTTGA